MYNPESLARADLADRRRRAGRNEPSIDSVAAALEYTAIFSQCSKRELKLVAKLAKTKMLRAGTELIKEGETGDSMFVMISGHAKVSRDGRKLADISAGGVVGELAVFSKEPRNATVTLSTDAEVATINRRDVYRLIEDAPGFARKLLEAMANRIRDLHESVT
jgi:CRP-like cAMP-binding protein